MSCSENDSEIARGPAVCNFATSLQRVEFIPKFHSSPCYHKVILGMCVLRAGSYVDQHEIASTFISTNDSQINYFKYFVSVT